MAKIPTFQKSLSGLLTLAFTLAVVGPGTWVINAPRASATTYTVDNFNDSGAGSLRQAVLDANANPGPDIIQGTVAGTLTLTTGGIAVTDQVTLDFTSVTQVGANFIVNGNGGANILTFNGAHSGSIVLGMGFTNATTCLDHQNAANNLTLGNTTNEAGNEFTGCFTAISANNTSGLTIVNSFINGNGNGGGISIGGGAISNVTIGDGTPAGRVYIYGNSGNGISAINAANLTIKGNYIGVDKNGNSAPNGLSGISIQSGCTNVLIGGVTAGDRNIISGNSGAGINIQSAGVNVQGNYIGTDPTGLLSRANGLNGINLTTANNVIGGNTTDKRNVISGNTGHGIAITSASSNTIANNYIGIKADGSSALGNSVSGINITGGTSQNTNIGGASTGNTISGNNASGISIIGAGNTGTQILGNFIGTNPTGTASIANAQHGIITESNNTIIGGTLAGTRNIISSNGQNGIKIKSSSNTVLNNYIGSDVNGGNVGVTPNTQNGIKIDTGAASNIVGGTNANEPNFFIVANTFGGVTIDNTGGNFNKSRQNNYAGTGVPMIVMAPANESIAVPVITSAMRIDTNTVSVTGTSGTPNGTVDLMVDGIWKISTTANGSGAFSANVPTSSGFKVTATITNGTNSTSGSAANVSIVNDSTPSPTPTLSYSNSGIAGQTVNIYGTGATPGDTVYYNLVNSGILVGIDGSFTLPVTLLQGDNSYSITIVDFANNISTAAVANIFAIAGTPAPGTGGGGGVSTSYVQPNTPTTPTTPAEDPIDTSNVGEEATSMAGDTEVVDDTEVVTTTPTDTSTVDTTPTSTSSTSSTTTVNTTPTTSTTQPVKNTKPKTFYSGVYQYVAPIKVVSLHDSLPLNLIKGKHYSSLLLNAPLWKGKTVNGIPVKLIQIKLKTTNVSADLLNKDNDNDGLWNGEELTHGSNPDSKDSDGDGITDFQEVINGSDPSSPDTDHDRVPDNKDSQPLVYNDLFENSHETEAEYLEEQAALGNTVTEPWGVVDTDLDGLSDEYEILIGTDYTNADTDSDGITDTDEIYQYDSDPNNASSAGVGESVRVTNIINGETIAEGQFFVTGSASTTAAGTDSSTVGLYAISGDGSLTLLGSSEIDSAGRYSILTDEALKAGTQNLVVLQTTGNSPLAEDTSNLVDLSATYTVNVISVYPRPEYISLAIKNGSKITVREPTIDLATIKRSIVVVSWRSTIYTQTLIADADDQIVYAKAPELELGAHTVTWYGQSPSTGNKSVASRVEFNITNEAIVTGAGASGTSSLTLILGSIAVLSSLTALGLYFRRRNYKMPPK